MTKRQAPDVDYSTATDSADSASAVDSSDDDELLGRARDWANLGNRVAGPIYTHFPESKYWERSAEVRAAKNRHQERLDELYEGDREARIYETSLKGCDVNIEENMFPYECDEGISHWTLWSRRDLRHDEIVTFVNSWCTRNAPWVAEFSYEENPHVSFRVPHVHVFFRRRAGMGATAVTTSPAGAVTRRKKRRWDVPPTERVHGIRAP